MNAFVGNRRNPAVFYGTGFSQSHIRGEKRQSGCVNQFLKIKPVILHEEAGMRHFLHNKLMPETDLGNNEKKDRYYYPAVFTYDPGQGIAV